MPLNFSEFFVRGFKGASERSLRQQQLAQEVQSQNMLDLFRQQQLKQQQAKTEQNKALTELRVGATIAGQQAQSERARLDRESREGIAARGIQSRERLAKDKREAPKSQPALVKSLKSGLSAVRSFIDDPETNAEFDVSGQFDALAGNAGALVEASNIKEEAEDMKILIEAGFSPKQAIQTLNEDRKANKKPPLAKRRREHLELFGDVETSRKFVQSREQ